MEGGGGGENANKHRKDIEPTHRECIAYITRSIVVIQWIAIKSHVIDATNKIFSFIVPAAGQSRRVESPDKYSCGIQNKKRVFCTKKPWKRERKKSDRSISGSSSSRNKQELYQQ